MQYFNRHKHMDGETRGAILESITELYSIDGNMFPLQNMLYGLFDGFDYSTKIPPSTEMEIVEKQNVQLYKKIMKFCFTIQTYPKSETHNTQI